LAYFIYGFYIINLYSDEFLSLNTSIRSLNKDYNNLGVSSPCVFISLNLHNLITISTFPSSLY